MLAPRRAATGAVLVYLEKKEVPDDDDAKKMMDNVRSYLLRRNQQAELGRFAERLKAESNTQLIEGLEP